MAGATHSMIGRGEESQPRIPRLRPAYRCRRGGSIRCGDRPELIGLPAAILPETNAVLQLVMHTVPLDNGALRANLLHSIRE